MMKDILTWLWGHLPLRRRWRTALLWLLNAKFTVGVVGLIRDDERRVLLLKHTYRGNKPWGLPGGGLRPGESLEDCLRREVWEEVRMRVEIGPLLSGGAYPDRRLVDVIFYCHPAPGESLATFRPNAEVSEARFFAPSELPAEMSYGMRDLVQMAIRQADARDEPLRSS